MHEQEERKYRVHVEDYMEEKERDKEKERHIERDRQKRVWQAQGRKKGYGVCLFTPWVKR